MDDESPRSLKLYIVTGSRADYGHLRPLVQALDRDNAFEPSLIVTGSHLSSMFGETVNEIERDGFTISSRIKLDLERDDSACICAAMATLIREAADFLFLSRPDALVVYGDRWEMLAVAIAGTLARLPIAHIGGGDVTEGAYDEAFRHSLTKMSHIHFTTHEEAKLRVLQLGEDPNRVFNTGSLAIDALSKVEPMPRAEFEKLAGMALLGRNIIVTYHPTTVERNPRGEAEIVCQALRSLPGDVGILITKPGMDAGTWESISPFEELAGSRPHTALVSSLGYAGYVSALSLMDAVVGNSSSGLYEAPSFGKPTVNIGDRQAGRKKASSVLDTRLNSTEIARTIMTAISGDYSGTVNPYGDGQTADRIKNLLRTEDWRLSVKKKFFCN